MPGIHIGFATEPSDHGGTNRVNRTIAGILRRRLPVAPDPAGAAVQVHSLSWNVPASPRRLFIDHGAFADAGFWAYTAPRLRGDDTILVSSTVCLRVAERLLDRPRPELLRVPYYADTAVFRPPRDRGAARRAVATRHRLDPAGPWLVAVSGYNRRKNLHLAIRFHRALAERHPETTLIVVGRPADHPSPREYAGRLRELAAGLGSADRVRFLDVMPHTDLAALLGAADLLLHLSTARIENFGLVVAEALAAGLPVVAADWGGLRDLVRSSGGGILAPTWLTRRGPRVDWGAAVEPAAGLLDDRGSWTGLSDRAARFAATELGLPAFERRLCTAVSATAARAGREDGAARLSEPGQALMFETIRLHMREPGIRSSSEEYDRLLALDAGELARLLTGPAATHEHPPCVGPGDVLYPAVELHSEGGTLEVTDPAWPATLPVGRARAALAERCDGRRTLAELLDGHAPGERATLEDAQQLVEEGLLAPRGRPVFFEG